MTTLTAVLGAIAALGTIAASVYGIFKWIAWKTQVTPEQVKENIDSDVQKKEDGFESTGRPQ